MFGHENIRVKDIHSEVMKISSKMDVIGERNRAADVLHSDHEYRIRALERWRYALPLSALSSVVAVVVAVYQR